VRARDDDRPDLRIGQPLELRGHALDGAPRLDVAVEQVSGDQEQIDLLRERKVDRGREGGELPLTLGTGLFTEIVMPGTEVDIGGVDDP
jgi:hypothetical protein